MADEIKGSDIVNESDVAAAADAVIFYMESMKASFQETAKAARGDLKKAMSELNKVKFDNSSSIADHAKAIREVNKAQQEAIKTSTLAAKADAILTKEIEKETKAKEKALKVAQDANNIYKQESARLNQMRNDYKNLALQGRENGKVARAIKIEYDLLKKKLDGINETLDIHTHKVGDYKGQLRALLKEMQQLEPGSEAFRKAALKAGELKDKIKDANEAASDLATGSKFEQAGNVMSRITDDLKNADFEGAAEKTKTLANVIQAISFKEIFAGIKGMGSALLQLGKIILTSPIGIFTLAITGAAYAVYRFVEANEKAEEASIKVKESLKKLTDEAGQFYDRIEKAQKKFLVLSKKITEEQAKEKNAIEQRASERNVLQQKFDQQLLDAKKEFGVEDEKFEKDHSIKLEGIEVLGNITRINLINSYNEAVKKIQEERRSQTITLAQAQGEELAVITEEQKEEERKKAEEHYKELLKLRLDYQKQIRDLEIENIRDDEARELARLEQDNLDLINKAKKEIKGTKELKDYLNVLEENFQIKQEAIKQKYRDQEQQAFDEEANRVRKALEEINDDNLKLEIELLQYQIDQKKKLGKEATAEDIRQQEELIAELFKLRKKALEAEAAIKLQNVDLTDAEREAINNKLINDIKRLELEKQNIIKGSDDVINEQNKEALDRRQKELENFYKQTYALAEKELDKLNDLKLKALDKDISDREKNIAHLQKLAEDGNKDAVQALQDEQKSLVNAQLEKEREIKRQEGQQKAIAFFKMVSSYAEKDDPASAVAKASAQMVLAELIAQGLSVPKFWEGSERIADDLGKPHLPGRDGYVVRVDGSERVVDGYNNSLIGGMSNDELAALAHNYHTGKLLPDYALGLEMPRTSTAKNMVDSVLLHQFINKVDELKATIEKNKSDVRFDFHGLNKMIECRIENGMKKVINHIGKPPRF